MAEIQVPTMCSVTWLSSRHPVRTQAQDQHRSRETLGTAVAVSSALSFVPDPGILCLPLVSTKLASQSDLRVGSPESPSSWSCTPAPKLGSGWLGPGPRPLAGPLIYV